VDPVYDHGSLQQDPTTMIPNKKGRNECYGLSKNLMKSCD
jgi:hypothetical protein